MKKSIFLTVVILFSIFFSNLAKAEVNINTFFRSGNYIIIYGSQIQETSSEENKIAQELKKLLKTSSLVTSDNNVNDSSLKSKNLIILSNSISNNLLNFSVYSTTADSPFTIKNNNFLFGDKVYSSKDYSIVFIYPSYYNPEKYTLTYYSGTTDGLRMIAKSINANYGYDYKIIKNTTGKVIREGNFKKSNFTWRYSQQLDKNYENIKTVSTPNLKFYYNTNSYFSDFIGSIIQDYDKFFKQLLQATKTPSMTDKVSIYLYDSQDEKNASFPNGNIDYMAKEIHIVYSKNVNISKYFAKLLFNEILKFSSDKLIEKGFIAFAQDMKKSYLDKEVAKVFNTLKPKDKDNDPDLIKAAIDNPNSSDSEIIIGSFTKYLIRKYGFVNYKKIITQMYKINEFEDFYIQFQGTNISFASIENDWNYDIIDLSEKK